MDVLRDYIAFARARAFVRVRLCVLIANTQTFLSCVCCVC